MGKLYLLTGDIIENAKGMDAIVNAQNKYMINGSGICGLVYRNAGPELLKYCKENYNKNMEIGEVRVTPGFNLNMDIIHVYAPIYKEWENPVEKLDESYENMLNVIKENKYKKVIIPSLGTGAHGYIHSDVAQIVIKRLYEFVQENDCELYFINRFALYTNEYLTALLDLKQLTKEEIFDMLLNEEYCFKDFVDGKKINEMSCYEKFIYSKVKGEVI